MRHADAYMYINTGVPQGFIFCPLLFILHINHLPLNIDNVLTDLYADDSILRSKGYNVHELNDNRLKDIIYIV